jgi:ADP-heptose:LPS heptosyltransferase/SAM-dependent methyltransferase
MNKIPGRLVRTVKDLERAGFTVLPPNERSFAYTYVPNASLAKPHSGTKSPMLVTGMWGIGDCIHERAILRELMKRYEVWIDTPYLSVIHDLLGRDLHPYARRRASHARIRETASSPASYPHTEGLQSRRIGYERNSIKEHGAILKAMFASVGLAMPEKPDFSLPVPKAWHELLDQTCHPISDAWRNRGDRPLMVYRPVILNHGWHAPARCPDIDHYNELYNAIREQFFTVSIARLRHGDEWIVGPEQAADLKLHGGELSFEAMAALFKQAAFAFTNAGFTPVLAQAVGTPTIIVYGGNESYEDTNIVGAHLAPTLPIIPINPCRCHQMMHTCDKTIDMPKAHAALQSFIAEAKAQPRPQHDRGKILIFGTMYVDNEPRVKLTQLWGTLHQKLNPACDLLLVDSKSPRQAEVITEEFIERMQDQLLFFSFDENIGHLNRNGPAGPASSGRDGWGRAFCYGLQYAIDHGYEYVAHIESDSLLRLRVEPIIERMRAENINALSVPVKGTKFHMDGWAETALMFFSTKFLTEFEFIKRYNWDFPGYRRTPEVIIRDILKEHLRMEHWQALRGDKNQISLDNLDDMDWITHCRSVATHHLLDDMEIYERFAQLALAQEPVLTFDHAYTSTETLTVPASSAEGLTLRLQLAAFDKLNFGCGGNNLRGWKNFDAEVDITQLPLPFADNSASHIFAEHVVEHVGYYQAVAFFKDCFRVLAPGGAIRIAVPSVEQVWQRATADYMRFVESNKWAPNADLRGAMHAILFGHGHQTAWTEGLLSATLYYCGFKHVNPQPVGVSPDPALEGVEGHGKVIGDEFNMIETVVVEAMVDKPV